MRRLLKARKKAEEVLAQFSDGSTPIDVTKIASNFAQIIERSLEAEISGALIPIHEGKHAIVINADHPTVRKRFTIAHELGHLLIHNYDMPHADRKFKFRDALSSQGSALEEIEANQFAAELLMPRSLLLKEAPPHVFGYAADTEDEAFQAWVEYLAGKFDVSRQAMAIRLSSIFS